VFLCSECYVRYPASINMRLGILRRQCARCGLLKTCFDCSLSSDPATALSAFSAWLLATYRHVGQLPPYRNISL
jgi:hypothetical protein